MGSRIVVRGVGENKTWSSGSLWSSCLVIDAKLVVSAQKPMKFTNRKCNLSCPCNSLDQFKSAGMSSTAGEMLSSKVRSLEGKRFARDAEIQYSGTVANEGLPSRLGSLSDFIVTS